MFFVSLAFRRRKRIFERKIESKKIWTQKKCRKINLYVALLHSQASKVFMVFAAYVSGGDPLKLGD